MNKIFKITGYVFLSVLLVLYLVFLFVLPRTIDINAYKAQIQQAVKDSTELVVDFEDVDVITSPLLEAGAKVKNLSVKLPDGSTLFSAESIKGKVFLPSLLWLSVRVSCAEVESPFLNVEIMNGEKFKVAKVYEDIINKQRAERRANPQKDVEEASMPIDPSKIKVYVPALKLHNYKAVVNDLKAGHKLTLKGEQLKVGYFNGKVAKLKTDAQLLNDEDVNITANLDVNTFIPTFEPKEVEEVDDEAVFALPFVNPVSVYRDYNLKSDINSKLKIRQCRKNKRIWAKGYLNVDNTTLTLSGLELPKSYFNLLAKGQTLDIDSNFYVTELENIALLGKLNYGKKPYADFSLQSSKVHFANLLTIIKAYMDTIHIKNGIENMSAGGYLQSDFRVKTNFKTMESQGNLVVREGNIYDKNIGLLFEDINANFLFDNNIFQFKDTHVLINKRPLNISGKIDEKSVVDVNVNANAIPLSGLYLAFAPKEIKNAYNLDKGFLTLNAKITGEIKDITALAKADLEHFVFSDKAKNFIISNDLARFGIITAAGKIRGKFKNEGFAFRIPATNSVIWDELLIADMSDSDITLRDSKLRLNKKSIINFNAKIEDYLKNPDVKFVADGTLADSDLKILVGEAVAPYLNSKGEIPVKAKFESKGKKMKAVVQMQSSTDSFITPIKIDQIHGRKMLAQFLLEKNADVIKVYKSGLYVRKPNALFRDNLESNLLNAKEIIGVRAMVSNLSTTPFINLLKVVIKEDLDGSICIFPKSRFTVGGKLHAYGKIEDPKISGDFRIKNVKIPELMTSVKDVNLDMGEENVKLQVRDVIANGSDFNIDVLSNWNLLKQSKIADVRVNSRLINLDKLMEVSNAAMEILPKAASNAQASAPADIPVEVLRGGINLRKITTGDIVVKNTTGNISLFDNIFYLKNLKTNPIGGDVNGEFSMNLLSTEMAMKLVGKNFDMEKVLLDAMQMKDTLSGDMNFIANLSLRGVALTEQMESLRGYVDFNITDGQLGPFGKLENFLLAENIRENPFFSSTIGSIITNVVTIDTSHFNELYGHLTFDGGFANIAPIKSQGDVMSLYIAGKVGLVDNSADMKLRGKLGSFVSDSLGPLANINPVNLIKNTPGLNVVAAKTFALFCEEVSQEEMDALPPLGEGKSDDYATKFQVVLRGDTRKPLKMIKSFKWLALDTDIASAQNFVDTIPVPAEGEEGLSIEELIQLRADQAAGKKPQTGVDEKSWFTKLKEKFKKDEVDNQEK